MARRSTPDARPSFVHPPSNVQVTVVPGPRGPRSRAVRDRIRAVRTGVVVIVASIAVVAAAGGGFVALAPRGGRAARPTAVQPSADTGSAGIDSIAAAYRYPLGCLGITLSADRSMMLGRHSPCWRYGVYVTAVLRQVNGVWRLMLKATSPSCPAVVLPEIVRSALVTCERSAAPAPSR